MNELDKKALKEVEKNAVKEILKRNKLKLFEVFRELVLLDCAEYPEYMALMKTMRESVGSISFLEMDYCEKNTNE